MTSWLRPATVEAKTASNKADVALVDAKTVYDEAVAGLATVAKVAGNKDVGALADAENIDEEAVDAQATALLSS